MRKTLLFLALFLLYTSSIYASEKVEIYATFIETKNNIVEAKDGITVVYKDYYLSANRAKYNRLTGVLELFDNIRANYKQDYRILGDYAMLNIKKKEKQFAPFYMLEKVTNVWISAKESSALNKDVNITSGVVSGCDQNNPLWKMEFSSSDFDYESKWLNLYNTTLYIYDIPVFYLPYIGYSLDRRRKSGLLIPALALSDREGFYYQQPLYIVFYDSWDIELRPQIRTYRGYGIYGDFRFVDSPVSKGKLRVGYFKEYDKYFYENQLVNNKHYGFNFTYENRDVVNQWGGIDLDGQSGLYVDINNMNDVDYINLAYNNGIELTTAKQVLSRINVFYNTDYNYIGSYFKYYKDLETKNNDNTLQQLPTLHYHHYLDSLFQDYLRYSVDIQAKNIQRVVNKSALQADINLPLDLETSLFDEYLNVSYQANLFGQYSRFRSTDVVPVVGVSYDSGYFMRNYHRFTMSTDLTKPYEDLTHVVSLGATYTLGGTERRNGYYEHIEELCNNGYYNSECDFYNIKNIDESLEVDFTQHLYDKTTQEILYHRLTQRIIYLKEKNQYGELENELNIALGDNLSFYNDMYFNYDYGKFSKIYNQLTFTHKSIKFELSHLYKDSFVDDTDENPRYTSYITSTARYNYNKHYSYKFRYDYDLESQRQKSREIGFMYRKRCWDFGLRYVQNRRPQLSKDSSSYIDERFIYISIALKPVMKSATESSDYAVKLPE